MVAARRILVLDDDPTGSQAVHDLAVVFDPGDAPRALAESGSAFVLTNSRSLGEAEALALTRAVAEPVLADADLRRGLHLVSRGDSTLRGHVIAEPHALADAWERVGVRVDGFLFAPAMIEAGRFTRDDTHYAVVGGEELPVAATDFARDATFGYQSSDLRDFLAEKSQGTPHPVRPDEVLSLGLDVVERGPGAVAAVLGRARDRAWVAVNATSNAHLDTVAQGLALVEAEGRTFVSRCAPSFVRALAGLGVVPPLDAADVRALTGPGRGERGLVVVGSHVDLTSRQLAEVQRRSGLREVELDVAEILLAGADGVVEEAARAVREAWAEGSDVVVFTSRALARGEDPEESLRIARVVSDAVVSLVRRVRGERPAWVVAKGGITSHEVAHGGLGITRARVAGQFFPGQISLFAPEEAPPEVLGCPYVVFPGNVGSETALADVIDVLREARSG